MNSYDLGNLVRVSATFRDSSNALVDPAVVKCQVRASSGTITTYTYGASPELVREGAGVYWLDVDASAAGEWRYRWFSTGTGQAAAEDLFAIRNSIFEELSDGDPPG